MVHVAERTGAGRATRAAANAHSESFLGAVGDEQTNLDSSSLARSRRPVLLLLAAAVFTLGSLKAPEPSQGGNRFHRFSSPSLCSSHRLPGLRPRSSLRNLVRASGLSTAPACSARASRPRWSRAPWASHCFPSSFFSFSAMRCINRTMTIWFPRPLEIANRSRA